MDDRSQSASISTEKQSKTTTTNQYSNNQSKEAPVPLSENTKRPDTDFLTKNIKRVRMASSRNRYESARYSIFQYLDIIIELLREIRRDEDHFVFMTTGPVYPYSSQKLNASENALEQMRTYLKQV
jgi:hypothetical protein